MLTILFFCSSWELVLSLIKKYVHNAKSHLGKKLNTWDHIKQDLERFTNISMNDLQKILIAVWTLLLSFGQLSYSTFKPRSLEKERRISSFISLFIISLKYDLNGYAIANSEMMKIHFERKIHFLGTKSIWINHHSRHQFQQNDIQTSNTTDLYQKSKNIPTYLVWKKIKPLLVNGTQIVSNNCKRKPNSNLVQWFQSTSLWLYLHCLQISHYRPCLVFASLWSPSCLFLLFVSVLNLKETASSWPFLLRNDMKLISWFLYLGQFRNWLLVGVSSIILSVGSKLLIPDHLGFCRHNLQWWKI